ncbi:DUF6415 family natural product biosynthesis protein [Streptomyces sp. HO565]|uniref:DUF6415 family natural product biosynthesis protein n=1 Tax=Streptomyces sp. HO565 TaxID=2857489 RepID=UPI0034DBD3FA
MDAMTATAILAEQLTARGLTVTKQDVGTLSVTSPLHLRLGETVTTGDDSYLTDYGYEIGQYGDEPATASRIAFLLGVPVPEAAGSDCMTAAQQQPADADTISRLIAEALSATEIPPPVDRLVQLVELLRAETERLVPLVRRRADAVSFGSRDWYTLIQTAERAEDAAQVQIGTTPLAGAIHVADLARWVQELREAHVSEA